MPIYERVCRQCDERFEFFAPMSDSDSMPPCPKCGGQSAQVFSLCVRDRQFSGSESVSMTEGFLPKEVMKARQAMPNHQHCIRSDGSVVFSSRSEQKSYMQAFHKAFPQNG